MEIKTTNQIQELILSNGYGDIINDSEKKWVSVDSLIEWLDDNFRNQDGTKRIIEKIQKESGDEENGNAGL